MTSILERLPLLFHLLGFVAFLGGAFAQQELLKASRRAAPAVRDVYESLAAAIVTKLELPGLFVQVATGVAYLIRAPDFLKQGWLHGKLAAVAVLLVLSHLEMFNARAIVRLRRERGESAGAQIEARKIRHAALGLVGTLSVVVVMVMVVFVR